MTEKNQKTTETTNVTENKTTIKKNEVLNPFKHDNIFSFNGDLRNEFKKISGRSNLDIDFYGTLEMPLFLAKDVAEWIDYSKSNGKYKIAQMIRMVSDEEKGIYNLATLGGVQETWFLTEDGLYEICMLSRKPIAKIIKKTIKQYLRNIRITGAAIVDEQQTVDYYFSQFSDETKLQMVNELTEKNKELQRFYDDLLNTDGLYSMNTVSKELGGIGLKTLYKYLRNKSVMFYKDNVNIPYQRFMKQGLFSVVESPCADGNYRPTTYATKKGLEYIRKMLRKDELLGESN